MNSTKNWSIFNLGTLDHDLGNAELHNLERRSTNCFEGRRQKHKSADYFLFVLKLVKLWYDWITLSHFITLWVSVNFFENMSNIILRIGQMICNMLTFTASILELSVTPSSFKFLPIPKEFSIVSCWKIFQKLGIVDQIKNENSNLHCLQREHFG